MKTFLPVLTVAAAIAVSPAALAEGWYADGGYTHVTTDVDTGAGSADIDLGAISGRVGYDINPNFAVEGELAVGVNDESATQGAVTASLGLNYLVGAYGKAQIPVAENINLFARVGYGSAEVEVSVPTVSFADDADGFAWGVGGEMFFDGRNGFRIEYTQFDFDNTDADVFGVFYVRRFGGGR